MGIQSLQIGFLVLLFFAIAFAALAQRIHTPYPILLVVAGLLLGFAPRIPKIDLDPDVVFYVFLPPLLYAAAWNTSWREFSRHIVSILMLAIGLVFFTVVGVGAIAHSFFSGFDWRTGVVLGAVVSTTDAIAATSIASRMRVNRRIIDILEGESLVNDATGLLALEFSVAMLVSGKAMSAGAGIARFAYLSGAGIVIGLLIGVIVEWFERRIDDGPIEIAISILVAYASYFAAEAVHASGVIAVVVSGLYLGRQSVHFFSPGVRIQASAVWNALTFLLNALVFLLIGLQFRQVMIALGKYDLWSLLRFGALFSAVVIGLRLLWSFPGAYAAYFIRTRILHHQESAPPLRGVLVIGWAGMRGVIALAAALSLPEVIPQRTLIVFLTFCVIFATLVVQGLSLPVLIRALHLEVGEGVEREEIDARRAMMEAALHRIEVMRDRDSETFADVYEDVAQHYSTRLRTLLGEGRDEHGTSAEHAEKYQDVSRELLSVERRTAIDLRERGDISDDVLRRVLRELDLTETRIQAT